MKNFEWRDDDGDVIASAEKRKQKWKLRLHPAIHPGGTGWLSLKAVCLYVRAMQAEARERERYRI